MEITLDKKNSTEGLIKIKLSEGDYQPHVDEKVKDYAKKVNLKGFRPGKVPSGLIKQMYGKSILVEEINQLLSHKLSNYIKENNLKIIGEPLPNLEKTKDIDWDSQRDFEFEYQIGMIEDFAYEVSSKVKVKSYTIEPDKKVIDETVDDLKRRFGKVTYPETSEPGDTLTGELIEQEGDYKNEKAVLAWNDIEKKQQDNFTGLVKDQEVSFDLIKTLSKDKIEQLFSEEPEETRPQKGSFSFKVAQISRVDPAELNQELFDRVFGKDTVTSEEAFLEKIKITIGDNYKRETEHFLEHTIEDHYVEKTKIKIPEDFLKEWLKNSGQGKITDEVLEKEFNNYKRGVIWDLIKNRIAEDNNIKIEAEDVRAQARDLIISQFGGQAFAEQIQDRMDGIVDNYLSHENGQNFTRLYHQLRDQRILDHIKGNITLSEKKVSVDEFKKIVESHKH